MRVEAYRIGPGAEGYDEGFRFNVDVVGAEGRVEHRWQFIGREATRINAILEAGKHPCSAWWVEGGTRRLICTSEEAQEEYIEGTLFRRLFSRKSVGADSEYPREGLSAAATSPAARSRKAGLGLLGCVGLLSSLAGCVDPEIDGPPPTLTPAGYSIYFPDRGSVSKVGLDVYALFDEAMEDAAVYLWRYGVQPDAVAAAGKGYMISAVDHFLFLTHWSSTGYASGQIGGGRIIVAFYSRQRNADGPAWTRHDWGGGNVHSGILPKAYPALAHELGHHFFGGQFEHGWTPPVVNGRATAVAPDWTGLCVVGGGL